jgi:hypothetical protein
LPLVGTNAVFVAKTLDALSKCKIGYARFWNEEHVRVYQFNPYKEKKWRGEEVDRRWNLVQQPKIALQSFTNKKGLKERVRSCLQWSDCLMWSD